MSQDKIGTDQWVEQYQGRVNRRNRVALLVDRASKRLPVWAWLIILALVAATLPLLTSNDLVIRIAGNVALLGALALGLNVVVGYAGLLDLGFVAFYGIGAYAYAYLSSNFIGIHLPTGITLIAITVISGLFGLLLGLPSLRLLGDYLAIVTLGFGLIFQQLMTSMTRVSIPGQPSPVNLTGGPNGILNLDPIRIFGWTASSVTDYYYIMLVLLVVMMLVIYHLYKSRLGRAWSALREDELAAEAMGMPTRRLKVQAFATGAAIAGLCGGLFAAWQGSVFPSNFDTNLLINLYAIIVLGGLGSLPGVLIGSLVIVAVPDVLRNADLAGKLFYLGAIVTLFGALKPRWQTPLLLIAVAVFGLIVKFIILAIPSLGWAPLPPVGSAYLDVIHSWLVAPANPVLTGNAGNIGFAALLILGLGVTRIKNTWARFVVLIPTLYLLVFVWETRLSQEASVTRLLFIGVLLIVLMIYRPNGLLGQKRVEIV
ncbi:MAG TPA: branched-chain amino acid ABC transporter permease [Phototrophicaceae bacterium]|nr:branched-chain amino acid ABC transporter permease [Phototrophicaceae bacterium]